MSIIIETNATEAFYNLITEAEKNSGIFLEQDLQAFVVYALLRNIHNHRLKELVFAEALLSAVDKPDIKKVESVVDQALIYAGMFPKRAHKIGVSKHYYHDIGVTASVWLSNHYAKLRSSYYEVYDRVGKNFNNLVRVLASLVISEEVKVFVNNRLNL